LYGSGSFSEAPRAEKHIVDIVSQILGGIIAAALIKALFPGSPNVENVLAPGVGYARGVFLEAIATGALVLTVLILAIDKRTMTGVSHAPVSVRSNTVYLFYSKLTLLKFAIAAALFLGHMMNIPYTGAGLNRKSIYTTSESYCNI
jgi:aquaporin rerated protein, other eukaryote